MMDTPTRTRRCLAVDPVYGFICNIPTGHSGPHEAWGSRVTEGAHHVWTSEPEPAAETATHDTLRARLDKLIPSTMIWPPKQWDCTETGPGGDREEALDYWEDFVRKVTA